MPVEAMAPEMEAVGVQLSRKDAIMKFWESIVKLPRMSKYN